jgi:hypothetical protein
LPYGVLVWQKEYGVILHLRSRVEPSARDDLIAFVADARPFYEAPGGISVRLLWEASGSGRFIEAVTYADETAHDQDQVRAESDPTMASYLARWHQMLVEPVTAERYRDLTPLLGFRGSP